MDATTNQVLVDYRDHFEDAISRYSPTLFRVALRRLRNVEDAEDAVQDALLSAYKHIDQFEGRSKLSTWLTTIVSNVALMKLRRYSRYEMFSLDQEDESDRTAFASKLKDARPNPENICVQAEMDESLRRALGQLSPEHRSAIQMCEMDGFTIREAATILGISTNTLKSRVSRARGSLGLLLPGIGGTCPSGTAAAIVDRKRIVRRKRNSAGLDEASADSPIGAGTRVSKRNSASVYCRDTDHGHKNLHNPYAQNCYPPHAPRKSAQFQPQGYAT